MSDDIKQKFKPGELVRLKSGGPLMTVERVGVGNYYDEVSCVWFIQDAYEDEPTYQTDGDPFWGGVEVHAFRADVLVKEGSR